MCSYLCILPRYTILTWTLPLHVHKKLSQAGVDLLSKLIFTVCFLALIYGPLNAEASDP